MLKKYEQLQQATNIYEGQLHTYEIGKASIIDRHNI